MKRSALLCGWRSMWEDHRSTGRVSLGKRPNVDSDVTGGPTAGARREVPICAAPMTTTVVVMARHSGRGEVREIAESAWAPSRRGQAPSKDRSSCSAAPAPSCVARWRKHPSASRRGSATGCGQRSSTLA